MKKGIERRVVAGSPLQLRAADGQPTTITGYAAVFNTEAVIAGLFRERIAPGAFRNVIGAGVDVRALFNHDDNFVLGRTTNGTLRLSEDERGLRYEFDPNPDDPTATGVVAKVRRGDVTQSSYGFRVKDGGEEWTRAATRGELPLRTITEFELLRDVSPVTFPAFEETTAEARSAAAAAAVVRAAGEVDDDTPEESAEEAAAMAALDAASSAAASAIAACSPLLSDEDAGGPCREAVSALACAMAACGRAAAACGGQPVYSYYSAPALDIERARLDVLALE